MGVFFNFEEYGDIVDAPANDGAGSFIGALASEAVGAITNAVLKVGDEKLVQELLGARSAELAALARYTLATSLQNSLSGIAAQLTDPVAISYYSRMMAVAADDAVQAKLALASLVGQSQNLAFDSLVRAAYGEKVATALGNIAGSLAGGAYTAVKLKNIIDNEQNLTPNAVELAFRKEIVNYTTTAIGELTAATRSFIASGLSATNSSPILRSLGLQFAPSTVATATTSARALWTIGRASVAGVMSSAMFEGGWWLGEILRDIQVAPGTTLQEIVSRGLIEPIWVAFIEDPRNRSEPVALTASVLSRVAPLTGVEVLSALLDAARPTSDPFSDSAATLAAIMSVVRGSPQQPAATPQELSSQVGAFFTEISGQSFTGRLALMPAELQVNNIAHRYALVHLNGFAIEGLDYTRFNQNGELDVYDPNTGAGALTAQWLADRSALLEALVAQNIKDGSGVGYSNSFPTDRAYEFHWTDNAGQAQILIGENTARQGGVLQPVPRQIIHFGSDAADTLQGEDRPLGDHLYGGAGADTVQGLGGADHLEGNAGADSLEGGAGNDTLVGGADADSYRFNTASGTDFGSDTVIDAGGQGQLMVDGYGQITTNDIERLDENTWRTRDGKVYFTRRAVDANRVDLNIRVTGTPTTGTITVQNWQDSHLGLSLGGTVQMSNVHVLGAGNDWDVRSNVPPDATTVLRTGAGHDAVSWHAINTTAPSFLFGEGGNDMLFGGGSTDVIDGGEGNDVLAANEFSWRKAA